jgi:Recombinase/Recombinase zinc beta ribbon domain/ParB-like nuclease domain
LPGWLRWNDDAKAIEIIPERAAIVRRMFELADIGWGQHRIAAWLNETTGEPWGRGKRKGTRWHRSYVRKVLTNPAVVGTFTPHTVERDPETRRKLRKPLDAIHHRFPAVVDRELFERVSSRIGSTAPRGRHARTEVRSIFSGVLKCRHCGGTVTRVSKGEYVYLVCSAANSSPRTCQYEALPYNEIEEAFIHGISRTIEEAPAVRLDHLRIADQVFQWRRIGYDIEASTDHVLGLARALVNNGKPLEPILVLPIGEHYYVIDGHHRIDAYHSVKWSRPIPVENFDGTVDEARIEALVRNSKDKLRMTTEDKTEGAWKLVKEGSDLTVERIAEITQRSERQVYYMRSAWRQLHALPPERVPYPH